MKSRSNKFLARCEACEKKPLEVVEPFDSDTNPYLLCKACHERLHRLSLRPAEWYRLARLHNPSLGLLGREYYTDGGVALTSDDEMEEEPWILPAPVLKDVCGDIEKLWEHTLTRRELKPKLLAAWRKHPKARVAEHLSRMWEARKDAHSRVHVLGVCECCLGKAGAGLVRQAWEEYEQQKAEPVKELADDDEDEEDDEEDFEPVMFGDFDEAELMEALDQGPCDDWSTNRVGLGDLAAASAGCLSVEGFDRVIAEIEKCQPADWVRMVHHLTPFRSERTLEWIEAHIQTPVILNSEWGKAAALSRLTWSKVVEWLEQGRPMSHVAIDALSTLIYDCGEPLSENRGVRLIDPPSKRTLARVLNAYAELDPVPRVQRPVDYVLTHSEVLLEGKPLE